MGINDYTWVCADFVFDCNLKKKITIREYPNSPIRYPDLTCNYPICQGLITQGKNIATFLPSIKENERYSISNISIFPNPFTNFINIGLEMKQSDNLTVKMYDLLHRQIHSQQFNTIAGDNLINFEIGDTLINGIYTIEIETSNGSKVFAKVIKGN